ncbi:MAG: hypothetical protein ACLP7Q_22055, partial [Isosphaeraceae bacterium]
ALLSAASGRCIATSWPPWQAVHVRRSTQDAYSCRSDQAGSWADLVSLIVVVSDPKLGLEEPLDRHFNIVAVELGTRGRIEKE